MDYEKVVSMLDFIKKEIEKKWGVYEKEWGKRSKEKNHSRTNYKEKIFIIIVNILIKIFSSFS